MVSVNLRHCDKSLSPFRVYLKEYDYLKVTKGIRLCKGKIVLFFKGNLEKFRYIIDKNVISIVT